MTWRIWIAAIVLALSMTALGARPVSFADLARHVQYKDVKISPDGKYLAATAVVKGQTVLALIRLSDKQGNIVRPRDNDDVIHFWWASSTRVLYSVGTRVGGFDSPFATGELFAVNADGYGADMLYGFRRTGMTTGSHIQHGGPERGSAEFISAISGDPYHVLVAISSWGAAGFERQLPVAYRMDIRDGVKYKIITAPMRGAHFVADHQGRIRFAYGVDKAENFKVYLHPVGGDGWQLQPELGRTRSIPFAFKRDDSAAYATCPGASGGFGICLWHPKKPTLETLWSNARVEPDGLLQGFARDSVIGVAFMDGRPGAALFTGHPADTKALIALMKQFPGENVRFVSGTRDGRLSVVRVDADVDPGTFYLYDRDSGKLTPLLARESWINPEKMASKQPFNFTARDGLNLQGYLSYPPGEEGAKHLPMVVFVHGGPYGIRDRWNFDPYVQAMATRGYAVLQVNYRGSGGYGKQFERAGWLQWGGKMQDDVTDATRWAVAKGIADPQRICIFGGSYGGYAALEGAVKEPDLYKCAIGYVGVYDLALMYKRGDIPQSSNGESYLKEVLGQNMKVLAQHSPINQLDRLKAKVMLIVGGRDMRVPPIQGEDLHMALLKRHIAHVWIDKPDEMHGFYKEANVAELFAQLVQFLNVNIGPGSRGMNSAGLNPGGTTKH